MARTLNFDTPGLPRYRQTLNPSNTMSPNPRSEGSSSFDPSNHRPPLSLPVPLQLLQIQFHTIHLMSSPPSLLLKCRPLPPAAPNPPPQTVPEISSETSAPPSTRLLPRLYPTSLDPLPVPSPLQLKNRKLHHRTGWLGRLSVWLQCGRPGFDPWVGKIPWRRKWQSTPVLLPGKSYGQV